MADVNITGLPLADNMASDDFIEIAGGTNGNRRLDLRMRLLRANYARMLAQHGGLYIDPATSGRRLYISLGSAGNVGSSDWTLPMLWMEPPSANPSASIGLFSFAAVNTGVASGAAGLVAVIETSGQLRVTITDNYVTNTRRKEWDNFVTTHLRGEPKLIHWRRNFAGDDFDLCIDGVAIAPTRETTAGSPVAWTYAHAANFLVLSSSSASALPTGTFVFLPLLNRRMSAAECLAHAQTGQLPTSDQLGTGSVVPIIDNDFATDPALSSWVLDTDVTWDSTNSEVDFSSAGSARYLRTPTTFGTHGLLRMGWRYEVEYEVKNYVSGTFLVRNGAGVAFDAMTGDIAATSNGVKRVQFVNNLAGSRVLIGNQSGSAASAAVDNVKVRAVAPVFDLEADPNRGWRDRRANQLHGVRTDGTQYVGAKVDSFPAWRVSHSGSGPLQFGGGTALDTTKTWVMDTLVVRSTAAVTWSLGNASGGKQYVADFALAVGDNYITGASLVTRLLSGANLWSQSSAAAEISIFPVLRRTS